MSKRLELLIRTTSMLLEVLPSETIGQLSNITEDKLIEFFFGLGTWIRNNLLNDNSALVEEFNKINVVHKDTMSTMMIEALHQHLKDTICLQLK